jgi:small subunit ribosomal protein S15
MSTEKEMTTKEVATLLQLNPSTIGKWAIRGDLPSTRNHRGQRLFKESDVMSFQRTYDPKKARRAYKQCHHPLGGAKRHYSASEQEIVKEWRLHEKDRASVDVEIGLLTDKINRLEEHLRGIDDTDEFGWARLHLIKAVGDRHKRLNYLKNTDASRYQAVMEKIALTA